MSDIFRKIAQNIISSDAFMQALEDMIASQTERAIKAEAAGDRFYVANNSRDDIKKRNKLINAQFNGHNIAELAKCWNLKERQIRNIIRRKT